MPVYAGKMEQMINIIGPTIFVILLGYLLGRFGKPNVATLIDVAMFVATPCLVFNSLYSSQVDMGNALKLWGMCVIVMVGNFVVAWAVFGAMRKRGTGVYLPVMFANTVNMPFPIIYLAFGEAGVANAVLYYIPNAFLIYSLGIYMASGQKEVRQGLKAVLRTPLIYAAILALILNLNHVAVPDVVINSFKLIGQAGVPLMLLILGINIQQFSIKQIPVTLTASVIRMGGGFAFAMLSVWLFRMTGLPRAIGIFQSSMPSAVFVSLLATKFNNEAELVSSIVLATTMFAVGVIPALLYFLT
jgi:malate permease and related proteins